MTIERPSPCKVNLLLNILGKRPDGFHDLETLIHPVNLCDTLEFTRCGDGVVLTCSERSLPVDSGNLVHRAATEFLAAADIKEGVSIRLEKRIPMAAGLGGGSGNAATTLLGLNELFGRPLGLARLHELAARLGSDVPFFLQAHPAIATGRGETIEPLGAFAALRGTAFLLIHPGFGIATAWAYREVARFPESLCGRPGRARALAGLLTDASLAEAARRFYNSLEAPAFEKFPILQLYQEFLRTEGADASLMSGSGSTTFAVVKNPDTARELEVRFRARFGNCWTAVIPA
jgi:4-diphosphocytidyl-2-C-methyl-D-erythritol kinase